MTIQAHQLTKRYGPVLAVDGLSFQVLPGRVTGLLGPNGAGKSTTMRLILGLDLVFILPGIVGALPSSWGHAVTPFLPSDAGQALIARTKFAPQGLHLLSPWVGLAVVCAYATAALAAAAVLLRRRDA